MSEQNQWPPPGCPPIEEALHTLSGNLQALGLNLRIGTDSGLWADLGGWSFLVSRTSEGFEIVTHVAPEEPSVAVYFVFHTLNFPLIREALQEVGLGADPMTMDLQRKFLGRPGPWGYLKRFDRADETLGKLAAAFGRRGILFALLPWLGDRR